MFNDEYMNISYHLCERIRILFFGILLRAIFRHFLFIFLKIQVLKWPQLETKLDTPDFFLQIPINISIVVVIGKKSEKFGHKFFSDSFFDIFLWKIWVRLPVFTPSRHFYVTIWCWKMILELFLGICMTDTP